MSAVGILRNPESSRDGGVPPIYRAAIHHGIPPSESRPWCPRLPNTSRNTGQIRRYHRHDGQCVRSPICLAVPILIVLDTRDEGTLWSNLPQYANVTTAADIGELISSESNLEAEFYSWVDAIVQLQIHVWTTRKSTPSCPSTRMTRPPVRLMVLTDQCE